MNKKEFIKALKDDVRALSEYMTKMRRIFHENPEIGFQEYKTSSYIEDELKKMKIPYRKVGETGIIANIGKNNSKEVYVLRSDMDALHITENSKLEYASKNDGYMHACGHDGHMASLLGAIKVIKEHEDMLTKDIRIIFQPSEENCKGALFMLENGALNKGDEIFGVHIFTDIEAGKVSLTPGNRMAVSRNFKAIIKGKAGHAAKPHLCADATLAAATFVVNSQGIVSRMADPIDSLVVTFGKLISGTAHNIISGQANVEGTIRFYNEDTGKKALEKLTFIGENSAKIYDCTFSLEVSKATHPAVINDAKLSKEVTKAASLLMDNEKIVDTPAILLGEDFSNYTINNPGLFAFVGGYNSKKDCIYPNHHDSFNFDEDALLDAASLYLSFAFKDVLTKE
ncbi:amidohydrolase [Acetitomaculum ruminis DSM 5522]|uniref:Amidohydrolase n=1 Tax=Acetitomaculum ruminis DSM 5522 TaxID=1120918 RepID=A0A1I1AGS2_9FIRM|nr:amidohydrolase [Acetitomaculum ruminis]SFB37147.1 amidohydrolase [Acetitomaculum ruminis DSM 5522]